MDLEPEDYSTYSDKDLDEMLRLHNDLLKQYDEILKRDLSDTDRFAVELSKKYLLQDLETLKQEIEKRKQ
jgi:hypothetical protein